MVVLNKIYTRTGDAGTTALGTGERVPKHAQRVAAYGSVDETNASIGLARAQLAGAHGDLDAMLARIQNDLFDLGADLCAPEAVGAEPKRERLRVSEAQVRCLEEEIDRMLRSCVHGKLPGHAINDPSFLQPARGMNAIGG